MIKVWTDGSCRNNGKEDAVSGIAVVAFKDNQLLFKWGGAVGWKTNNEAEYSAVLRALLKLETYKQEPIYIYCDSALVVNQLNGIWKIKDSKMQHFHDLIKTQISLGYADVHFNWIPREENEIANDIAQKMSESIIRR